MDVGDEIDVARAGCRAPDKRHGGIPRGGDSQVIARHVDADRPLADGRPPWRTAGQPVDCSFSLGRLPMLGMQPVASVEVPARSTGCPRRQHQIDEIKSGLSWGFA